MTRIQKIATIKEMIKKSLGQPDFLANWKFLARKIRVVTTRAMANGLFLRKLKRCRFRVPKLLDRILGVPRLNRR